MLPGELLSLILKQMAIESICNLLVIKYHEHLEYHHCLQL